MSGLRAWWGRFWSLRWRWKAPILVVVAFVLLVAIIPTEPADEATEPAGEAPAATATVTTEARVAATSPPETATPEPTEEATPEPEPESATATPTAVATAAASRCETVPEAGVAVLEDRLTVDGGGTLRGARAVRSEDFESVWFVAADIEGAGMESPNEIGVWALGGSLNAPSAVFSVGSFAHEFSDWTHGEESNVEVTRDDDGFDEAVECTEAALAE